MQCWTYESWPPAIHGGLQGSPAVFDLRSDTGPRHPCIAYKKAVAYHTSTCESCTARSCQIAVSAEWPPIGVGQGTHDAEDTPAFDGDTPPATGESTAGVSYGPLSEYDGLSGLVTRGVANLACLCQAKIPNMWGDTKSNERESGGTVCVSWVLLGGEAAVHLVTTGQSSEHQARAVGPCYTYSAEGDRANVARAHHDSLLPG